MPAKWVATRELDLSQLTRFPGNARRGNVDEIRKSIRRHGQYRAIVVRDTGDSLVILAGNHTRDALEAEGHQTARCEIIQCSDDEAHRIAVADNRLSDLAFDDSDALLELLSSLDGDYDGTGWSEDDVHALLTPSGDPVPDSADLPPGDEDKYREQYGVIVVCDTEIDQQQTYEDLQAHGYRCRVVTT